MWALWKVFNKGAAKCSFSRVCTSLDNVRYLFNCNKLLAQLKHTELNQLTGIAAILTFPLDIEVVEAEEREEAEESAVDHDETISRDSEARQKIGEL